MDTPIKVLIVDDSLFMRKAISEIVQSKYETPFQVSTCILTLYKIFTTKGKVWTR